MMSVCIALSKLPWLGHRLRGIVLIQFRLFAFWRRGIRLNCVQHGAGFGCGPVGIKLAVCGCVFCGVVSDLVWPDLLWSGLGLDIGLNRNVLA